VDVGAHHVPGWIPQWLKAQGFGLKGAGSGLQAQGAAQGSGLKDVTQAEGQPKVQSPTPKDCL
jgi:hypothetical protein